jgi:hypothetical protein
MQRDWKSVTPRDLQRRIDIAQQQLASLVSDRDNTRRDVPERQAIKLTLDFAIYASNSMVETSSLLLARLTIPSSEHVWDRYLVVYLHAALDAYPKLASKLIQECRKLNAAGHSTVDAQAVAEAYRLYKKRVYEVTGDAQFMADLHRVRNTVGAHHLTPGTSGIDGLVDWVAAQANPDTSVSESLLLNTLTWSMLSVEFGRDAFAALHAAELPPIARGEEYRRLESALDDDEEALRDTET